MKHHKKAESVLSTSETCRAADFPVPVFSQPFWACSIPAINSTHPKNRQEKGSYLLFILFVSQTAYSTSPRKQQAFFLSVLLPPGRPSKAWGSAAFIEGGSAHRCCWCHSAHTRASSSCVQWRIHFPVLHPGEIGAQKMSLGTSGPRSLPGHWDEPSPPFGTATWHRLGTNIPEGLAPLGWPWPPCIQLESPSHRQERLQEPVQTPGVASALTMATLGAEKEDFQSRQGFTQPQSHPQAPTAASSSCQASAREDGRGQEQRAGPQCKPVCPAAAPTLTSSGASRPCQSRARLEGSVLLGQRSPAGARAGRTETGAGTVTGSPGDSSPTRSRSRGVAAMQSHRGRSPDRESGAAGASRLHCVPTSRVGDTRDTRPHPGKLMLSPRRGSVPKPALRATGRIRAATPDTRARSAGATGTNGPGSPSSAPVLTGFPPLLPAFPHPVPPLSRRLSGTGRAPGDAELSSVLAERRGCNGSSSSTALRPP